MRFNILVTGAVYSTQSAFSALQYCQAAVAAGHTVAQVFFYQDGVSQASGLSVPLSDEYDAVNAWGDFAKHNNTDLVVCVSAGERRGVLGAAQAAELKLAASNMHASFRVEGLGVLHQASLAADRTVTFK